MTILHLQTILSVTKKYVKVMSKMQSCLEKIKLFEKVICMYNVYTQVMHVPFFTFSESITQKLGSSKADHK